MIIFFIIFLLLAFIYIEYYNDIYSHKIKGLERTQIYAGGAYIPPSKQINMAQRLNEDEIKQLLDYLEFYIKYSEMKKSNELPYRESVFINPGAKKSSEMTKEEILANKGRADICTTHLGQRKLLLNEIEFLTMYGHLSNLVLYIGAADGQHTEYMARVLFPDHKFILYDPRNFHEKLVAYSKRPKSNVELRQRLFTNDEAKEFVDKNPLLICDIRTWENKDDLDGWVKEIQDNMDLQAGWVDIIHPAMASLKFRLLWTTDTTLMTDYFDGEVYTQPWQPPKSTEARLYTDGKRRVKYSPTEYENKCYRHNVITRIFHDYTPDNVADYSAAGIDATIGIDWCYDCRREVEILEKYCCRHFGVDSSGKITDTDKITDTNKINATDNKKIKNKVRELIGEIDESLQKPLVKYHLSRNNCFIDMDFPHKLIRHE